MIYIKATEWSKTKADFLPVMSKGPISNTNPNKIKLRMLQVELKCKQLEEKIQYTQRELKINNQKVDNMLNEDFIEIINFNSGKMTPFTSLYVESAFCLGGTTQYQLFTTSKRTHPNRL